MISLKATLEAIKTKLNAHDKALSVDYIVEQGTSGIWTYRKWNSGIAECWGKKTYSSLSKGDYVSAHVSLPSIFSDSPVANASCGVSEWATAYMRYVDAERTKVYCYMYVPASASAWVYWRVIGKWK